MSLGTSLVFLFPDFVDHYLGKTQRFFDFLAQNAYNPLTNQKERSKKMAKTSTRKPPDAFLTIGGNQIYMDFVFFEAPYPALFTCVDDSGNTYIAACFHADSQEKKWIIAGTTPATVIDLLCNRVSIRDIFPKGSEIVWVAVKSKGFQKPVVDIRKASDVPEEIFPTPGYYLDADEGEFDEEIAVLMERNRGW